jgi:hypothetical protein
LPSGSSPRPRRRRGRGGWGVAGFWGAFCRGRRASVGRDVEKDN